MASGVSIIETDRWISSNRLIKDLESYDLGYRSNILDDLVVGDLSNPLIILTGPRRVGKSVALIELVKQILSSGRIDPRQIIYLPCDGFTPRDIGRALTLGRDLTRIVDQTVQKSRIWLLDELTGIKGWSTVIKAARDGTPLGQDTVVVTGSQWQKNEDIEGNLFAGRAGLNNNRRLRILLPMNFRSFMKLTRPHLPCLDVSHPAELQSSKVALTLNSLAFDLNELDLAWQAYLSCGGFPRAVAEYHNLGDVSSSFYRDIGAWLRCDVDPDDSPQSIPLLLEELMTTMTSPLSLRATAEMLAFSRTVMSKLLNRLVFSFGAIWAPQFNQGKYVVGSQAKIYLTDPLLAWLPSKLRAGLKMPDFTALTEAVIAISLAKAVEERDEGRWIANDTIGYVRTGNGKEIDFAPISFPGFGGAVSSVPIESKWTDNKWRAEAQVMSNFYGNGILATKSLIDVRNKVWAVPAPLLALLLG